MNAQAQKFYSNGKLLLTGEYLVLDGALALAIPTKYGQSLSIEPFKECQLRWESFDELGNLWFEATHAFNEVLHPSEIIVGDIKDRMFQILRAANEENREFLNNPAGIKVTTQLDFPRQWGLGTSSTLINNVAQWANINAYKLLDKTFGGSGYDIACAQHNTPITYQLEEDNRTVIEHAFNPHFKNHLFFVFLNKKQDSRQGIAAYKEKKCNSSLALSEISAITNDMLSCKNLETFQFLMESHERIISETIQQKPVKEVLFSDFNGSIKSLGAWGGDFVLAASEEAPEDYFRIKGYDTIIPYQKMIL